SALAEPGSTGGAAGARGGHADRGGREAGRRDHYPLEILLQERLLATARAGLPQRCRWRDAGVAAYRGQPPFGGDAYGAGGASTRGERRPGAVATGVDEPDAERDGGDEGGGRRAHDNHRTRGPRGNGVGE